MTDRQMTRDPETYFAKGCGRCARFDTADCAAIVWSEGLARLRTLIGSEGATETVKWGQPCYMHAGRNIAIIGALRSGIRLSFFEAGLLSDSEGLLQKPGPHSATASMIAFSSAAEVAQHSAAVKALLHEAMEHAEAGRVAPKVSIDLDWPEELVRALDNDPTLAEAFHVLTPGRQKSYVLNLLGARKSETRLARIEKFRPKIMAGLGLHDQV